MAELLLIRHGQASFGADDYDCLSPLGERQSALLGGWLARTAPAPDKVIHGSLLRHRQTAEHCLAAAGTQVPCQQLAGLDELDHRELLARFRPDLADPAALRAELRREAQPRSAFQRMFVAAVARWTDGHHDKEYRQSWPAFQAAVHEALGELARQTAGQCWVFTSGGPIAVIVGHLLGVPATRSFELSWPLVNTALTRLQLGRHGLRLLSYNAWPHLEEATDPQLVTHR